MAKFSVPRIQLPEIAAPGPGAAIGSAMQKAGSAWADVRDKQIKSARNRKLNEMRAVAIEKQTSIALGAEKLAAEDREAFVKDEIAKWRDEALEGFANDPEGTQQLLGILDISTATVEARLRVAAVKEERDLSEASHIFTRRTFGELVRGGGLSKDAAERMFSEGVRQSIEDGSITEKDGETIISNAYTEFRAAADKYKRESAEGTTANLTSRLDGADELIALGSNPETLIADEIEYAEGQDLTPAQRASHVGSFIAEALHAHVLKMIEDGASPEDVRKAVETDSDRGGWTYGEYLRGEEEESIAHWVDSQLLRKGQALTQHRAGMITAGALHFVSGRAKSTAPVSLDDPATRAAAEHVGLFTGESPEQVFSNMVAEALGALRSRLDDPRVFEVVYGDGTSQNPGLFSSLSPSGDTAGLFSHLDRNFEGSSAIGRRAVEQLRHRSEHGHFGPWQDTDDIGAVLNHMLERSLLHIPDPEDQIGVIQGLILDAGIVPSDMRGRLMTRLDPSMGNRYSPTYVAKLLTQLEMRGPEGDAGAYAMRTMFDGDKSAQGVAFRALADMGHVARNHAADILQLAQDPSVAMASLVQARETAIGLLENPDALDSKTAKLFPQHYTAAQRRVIESRLTTILFDLSQGDAITPRMVEQAAKITLEQWRGEGDYTGIDRTSYVPDPNSPTGTRAETDYHRYEVLEDGRITDGALLAKFYTDPSARGIQTGHALDELSAFVERMEDRYLGIVSTEAPFVFMDSNETEHYAFPLIGAGGTIEKFVFPGDFVGYRNAFYPNRINPSDLIMGTSRMGQAPVPGVVSRHDLQFTDLFVAYLKKYGGETTPRLSNLVPDEPGMTIEPEIFARYKRLARSRVIMQAGWPDPDMIDAAATRLAEDQEAGGWVVPRQAVTP